MQANTVAEVYIDKNFEKKQAGTQAAIEKLNDQTAELRQNMYDAESEIHKFRLDQGITSYAAKDRGEAITAAMNRLESDYQDARRAREEVEGRLRNLEALRGVMFGRSRPCPTTWIRICLTPSCACAANIWI